MKLDSAMRKYYAKKIGLDDQWKIIGTAWEGDDPVFKVGLRDDQVIKCGECGRICYPHNSMPEQTWKCLDTRSTIVWVRAKIPTIVCPNHGFRLVRVPWAVPEGQFILFPAPGPSGLSFEATCRPIKPGEDLRAEPEVQPGQNESVLSRLRMGQDQFLKLVAELERFGICFANGAAVSPVVYGESVGQVVDIGHLRVGKYKMVGPSYAERANQRKGFREFARRQLKVNIPQIKLQSNWELHADAWKMWAVRTIASRKLEEGWSPSRKAAFGALLCQQLRWFPSGLKSELAKLTFPTKKNPPQRLNPIAAFLCGVSEGLVGSALTDYKYRPVRFSAVLRGGNLVFDPLRKPKPLPKWHTDPESKLRTRQHVVELPNPLAESVLAIPEKYDLVIVEGDDPIQNGLPLEALQKRLDFNGYIVSLRSKRAPTCEWICMPNYHWGIGECKRREAVLIVPQAVETGSAWEFAVARNVSWRPMTVQWNGRVHGEAPLGNRTVFCGPALDEGDHRCLCATWRAVLKQCHAEGAAVLGLNLSTENVVALVEATSPHWTLYLDEKSVRKWPENLDPMKRPFSQPRNKKNLKSR